MESLLHMNHLYNAPLQGLIYTMLIGRMRLSWEGLPQFKTLIPPPFPP